MNPDPGAAPSPKFTLKPEAFTAVNAPRGTDAPSADHDVFEILKQVRAREAAAGIGEVVPAPPRKSRRRRDYLRLLVAGNGLMLVLFSVEIFIGFQVQCLATRMPEEFSNLVYDTLHEGRPMFFLPAMCMTAFTVALSWRMFGVMGDY